MRFDMLDYPTAWEIQRTTELVHDPRCSAVNPGSLGAFLCDCDAVPDEWQRRKAEANSRD